jgi:hypothetical protein
LPGKTPREAFIAFRDPLQETLSCVSHSVWIASAGAATPGGVRAIRTKGEYLPLHGATRLHMSAGMEYEIVQTEDPDRGPWKVTTKKYMYHVVTDDHTEVVLFHWHPDGKVKYPHIHVGSAQLQPTAVVASADHMPTGRISFERVVHHLISQLGVVAQRTDHETIISENDARFARWRTWS